MSDLVYHPDVMIIGGGASGVAAAVSASNSGAKVALIERNAFPGGKATAAMVGTVCGLYLRSERESIQYAMNGFPKQFVENLMKSSDTQPISLTKGIRFLPYQPFAFKLLCDDLLRETNTQVFYHTSISNCKVNEHRITSVEAIALDRVLTFQPKTIIDCTGEALVSTLAKIEIMESHEYQAAAQVFYMEHIESTELFSLEISMKREIKKAIDSGLLDPALERVSVVPGSFINNKICLKIGFPKKVTNDDNKASEMEIYGRTRIAELNKFLKKYVPAFKNSHLGEVAQEVGIRTGRRPVGSYILQEDDILGCRKMEDGIANGAWPIEYWGDDKRVQMTYFDMEDYYQIPSGCLISKSLDNLFFAGRNISATEKAIASARVIGTCLGTGYAAGKIAAYDVLGKSRMRAIEELRAAQVNI